MRRVCCFKTRPAVWALLCLIFLCGRAEAAPVEATLFPNEARVTEASRVPVRVDGKGEGKAVVILPGQARPESLNMDPGEEPALKISSLSWRPLTTGGSSADDARRKQLRILTEERRRLSAEIKGLEARIAFWQSQTKAKTKTPGDAVTLSSVISRSTKKAWQEKMTLEGECEKLDQRIAALQAELKKPREAAKAGWEVSLRLTGLKPESRSISLKYSYTMSDCGWTPRYRLEANPRQGRVAFSWDAEVWQNSPRDWADVELSLATHPEADAVVPEKTPDWSIAVKKTGVRQGSEKKEKTEPVAAPIRNPVAPVLRHLGRRTVPAGQKMAFSVERENWPAVFIHVLRPFSSTAAAIRAVVALPSPVRIPVHPALFVRDGVVVGRGDFGFFGREKTLVFGSDPSVSSEVSLLSEPGNVPGGEGKRQVWDWRWQTVVKNKGGQPVRVRVEEPVPQIRDRRITFTMWGEPAYPEEKSAMGTRELELPPGAERTLGTSVRVSAPRDLRVDMNWSPVPSP